MVNFIGDTLFSSSGGGLCEYKMRLNRQRSMFLKASGEQTRKYGCGK